MAYTLYYNNSSRNLTGNLQRPEPVNNWIYHSFLIILGLLIISHNIFVIYLYRKDRRLRCAANLLLTSLAASDLITGVCVIPLTISSSLLFGRNDVGTLLLYFFSNTVSDFSIMFIAFNLLLVTADRYLSLCYSLHYKDLSRTSRAKKAIIIVISVCLVLSLLPLAWTYKILIGEETTEEIALMDKIETIYQIIYLCICFFVPAVLILFVITAMMVTIRRLSTDERHAPRNKSTKNTQVRAFIQFVVMYVSFLLCWGPVMTIRLMITVKYDPFTRDHKLILEMLFLVRCLTSLLNPGIHVWCKKDYRSAVVKTKEKYGIVLFAKNVKDTKVGGNSPAVTLPTNMEFLGDSPNSSKVSCTNQYHVASALIHNNNKEDL